uniref:FAST kinase domain-containing protein 2 n=1 Tax=Parasteatoda tepidariorum TaxID=114398 RepID=A0A2L2YF31_PARTP
MLRRSLRFLHPPAEWLCCCYKIRPNFHSAKVLCSANDRHLPNPSLPTPASKLYSHDADILFEQIRKTKSIERLLDLVSMHLDVMNTKHIVESMQIVNDFSKKPDFKDQNLMENEIFQGLCSRLMKSVRLLGPQDIITVYKTLSSIGVRNNTYVMQSILKMMGAQLNHMSLGQLIFLHFLLSRQRANSLVDGLKLALPLVLQVQIEQQLDSDNLDEVVNCLQLACRSRLKPSIIERVMSVVLQKAKLLSASNAVSIAFALLNLETPVDGYKELIGYSFEILSKNSDSLNQKQTLSILRLCRGQGYYNSRFLFAVADKAISEKWNFESTYETVSYFYKMNFAPQYFIDYFVDVICSEADTLRTKLIYSPLNCLEYLSLTAYPPPRLDEALEILCSLDQKISNLTEKSTSLLVKLIGCSATCGHFPRKYIELVLNSDYLFTAWSQSKKQGRGRDFEISISVLAWSLEVYEQSESYKFPPTVLQKLLSAAAQKYEDYQSPIESFIQHGIGGAQFLQSGLFTQDGIFIDHVLGMRSGNYPVSLQTSSFSDKHPLTSSSIKFVEDIILPEDAKIVAIIVAQEDQYCRDPNVLKGWANLRVRCLMKKKYCPVVINFNTFKEMPDREKIPYLMREIKQATEGLSAVNVQ